MPSCAHSACTRPTSWWQPRPGAGATLDESWYCSQACVEAILLERVTGMRMPTNVVPRLPGVRLGALLRHHRACPPEQITAALAAQAESRLRLGEQLRSMGAVEPYALLRALADQAGVSYLATVDPVKVHDAPGGLSIDAIQALRIVPIAPPDATGRIRVAFPAPVPRAALTALRQQTGWVPEPFLVSDEAWLALLEHYGTAAVAGAATGDLPVAFAREHDPVQAVRRLAEVVMAARTATMSEARWGHYVWVRLQGGGAGFDLLLDSARAPAQEQEDTWRAATTSR
ncbi:MAG TPA: hypothetical protein VMW48_13220 [Vicinamibacterales bacterium]|nr:hypothetical protein [Vicinamibacterales bacterium]